MLALFPSTLILLLSSALALAQRPAKRDYTTHNYYVLEHLPSAGSATLAEVAIELGLDVVDQVGQLNDHWIVRVPKPPPEAVSERSPTKEHDEVLEKFEALGRRAETLDAPNAPRSLEAIRAREIVSSVNFLSRQVLSQRTKRAPPPVERALPAYSKSSDIAARFGIADPIFPQQWHLANDASPKHMMNVAPVWDMGYTGKGVIAALVDDGLDYTSEDLAANFDAYGSYDFNDFNDLPTPTGPRDTHGTRCAGQIAAGKNDVCGVGIAYDSKITGLRILGGPIADVDEAEALNYGYQNTSIYSCSWGPPDNGKAMQAPNHLIRKAVVEGINRGRGGKGSVFVFASGNGAGHGDQCNFDGYTNSIYSVTVGAVDYQGLHPYYSEACAAIMIVAYSSGGGNYIVTTDRGVNKCATTHGGTSAAAPNAAGVLALALQARPDLTWRDVQYLCVESAGMINPDDPDWERTAAGRLYSYKYGYGVLDAHKYVQAALKWQLVKPQTMYETDAVQLGEGTMDREGDMSGGVLIEPHGGIRSSMMITKQMLLDSNFERLEHIDVRVWIDHTRRGDVEVELLSPHGVRSVLGGARPGDDSDAGYPGWKFMTVKHWGEDPVGEWTIRVSDQSSEEESGSFLGWNMILWGEVIDPRRATKFELAVESGTFPPAPHLHRLPSATTATHSRPTDFLDPEHEAQAGENSKVAFPAGTATVGKTHPPTTKGSASKPTGTPASGHQATSAPGWAVTHKWYLIFLFVFFNAGLGLYFWRRAAAVKQRENYASLPTGPGDDVPLNGMGRHAPSQDAELEDTFRDDDTVNQDGRRRE